VEDYRMLIDGEWVDSRSQMYIEVINPATEEAFARVPKATQEEVMQALKAAERAFPEWAKLSSEERGVYLWQASNIVEERKEEIGQLLTREQGKPLKEAMEEIQKAIDMLRYYAEEGKRVYGQIIPNKDPQFQSFVIRQPIGVVAAISPWNYPVELLGWKVAAALAGGCTIVAKPPSLTPLSPLKFLECLFDAGLPRGVMNAVTGSGDTVGRQLVQSPITKKIAFTGSTEVGKDILSNITTSIKKISLELGGHCPLIICKNCDLSSAVKGAVRRSFRNMGQICIAINRIYVDEAIHDDFLERSIEETRKLIIGNGLEKIPCDLGPMASKEGLTKTRQHIEDALTKGARLACGGKRPEGSEFQKGYFFEPTILSHVHHEMLLMKEETFGPVVGTMAFRDLEEAIRLANATPYGLAAYAYTNHLNEAAKIYRELEAGSVAINNVDAGIINAPYGGWKQSGIGYEHGHEGLEEYLHLKHIRIQYQEPLF
jgi:succinate-semialdehyde dehydrogenase/glutarate-semialdehyde dehydrogenase